MVYKPVCGPQKFLCAVKPSETMVWNYLPWQWLAMTASLFVLAMAMWALPITMTASIHLDRVNWADTGVHGALFGIRDIQKNFNESEKPQTSQLIPVDPAEPAAPTIWGLHPRRSPGGWFRPLGNIFERDSSKSTWVYKTNTAKTHYEPGYIPDAITADYCLEKEMASILLLYLLLVLILYRKLQKIFRQLGAY